MKEKQVTCDICNFANQEGVMGFDGCSLMCRNDKSEHYGKEIGFFSCKDCYVGETSLSYNEW